jgi:hypothetical protein
VNSITNELSLDSNMKFTEVKRRGERSPIKTTGGKHYPSAPKRTKQFSDHQFGESSERIAATTPDHAHRPGKDKQPYKPT